MKAILALHPLLDRLLHWQMQAGDLFQPLKSPSPSHSASAKVLPLRAEKGADGCAGAGLLRLDVMGCVFFFLWENPLEIGSLSESRRT